MKKLLLLISAILAFINMGIAQQVVERGQQIDNNHFESWTGSGTSMRPTQWNSTNNPTGTWASLGSFQGVFQSTEMRPNGSGTYCAKIKSVSKMGVKANGGISTGPFNMGSTTAADTKNCTYTSTNNADKNCVLTAKPDSIYFWAKTSSSTNKARVNAIIHNNVVSSNATDNAAVQDPNPTDASHSVVNTDSNANKAKFVAVACENYLNTSWTLKKIAFDYNTYAANNATPNYILITFSTSQTAGGGAAGDEVYLDDIILVYNTRLATLKANGTSIANFNPDVTTYTYPQAFCEGDALPSITFTTQSPRATGTITHNPTAAEPYTTIRVNHYNQANVVYTDYTINYTIIPAPTAPTFASTSVEKCYGTATVLTATPATGCSVRWYNTASGGSPLYTGASYTTTTNTNTTFYASSYHTSAGCESGRTAVDVVVRPLPGTPSVNSNQRCGNGTVVLTATPGTDGSSCNWYANATGGNALASGTTTYTTPSITSTTTYYVSSISSYGCESSRESITATVNPVPGAATADNGNRCGAGSMTLTATAGANANQCRWYANATGGDVLGSGNSYSTPTLSTSATYYVESYNSTTTCASSNRTPVQAVINPIPAAPTTNSGSLCGAGSVSLSATAGQDGTTCRWYAAATGGEALHTGSSYTTENISSTSNYYVSSYNATTACESSERSIVTATIHTIPGAAAVTPSSRCGAGNVTLSATAGSNADECRWYNAATEGSLLATGNSYTAENLNATTVYYVASYNSTNACEASLRTPVQATINSIPNAPQTTNDGQCAGGEAVELTANYGSSPLPENCNYQWFADAELTQLLATGNSYSPTGLTVGNTTFYANVKNSVTNCAGSASTAIASLYPTYNNIEQSVSACNSYTWEGDTYTVSGDYQKTLSSIYGCDSTVTLHLTIKQTMYTNIDTIACNSFTWNGETFNTSGTIQRIFNSTQGCDSVVTVNLTIRHSSASNDARTVCSNELPFMYNGREISAAGTYNITIPNAEGCDSVITFTVTVNNTPETPVNLTSGALCGAGNINLQATQGTYGNTCRWYSNNEGGEAIFTGNNFSTGAITTTTTYYVSSYNNTNYCESQRVAITATINAVPATPSVDNQLRCGQGEVTFTATIDTVANTCYWYDDINAPTADRLSSGLSYTKNITNTETFFVESINEATGCKSGRVEVSATAHTIPTAPVLTAQSHCGPQSFSLTAPATGYYKWYDNASSSEVLPITGNTTPVLNASRSYFISHAADYTGISCESSRSEWALTIYPVYEAQNIYDTICQHNTYTQHGLSETFDVAGDFDRILSSQSIHGCDSLVTLHLNVKEVRSHEWNHTACDSYTWNAQTYTASGDYIQYFTSSLGCDSTVTLHLTINKSKATEFSTNACNSYTWNDTTYTESGDYTQSFQTTAGCDSTVTLHLTINSSKSTTIDTTVCDLFVWNENQYTESQVIVKHFSTSRLCDSMVTVNLTVKHSSHFEETRTVCSTELPFTYNGQEINAAGTYYITIPNAEACDSLITLTVNVNTTPSLPVNLVAATRCGTGNVTLTANPGANGTTCRWYDSETAEVSCGADGNSLTLNNIESSHTYYVASYNPYASNGHACESGRSSIAVTINPVPATPSVDNQVRCGNGEVTFTATTDAVATTCRWYATVDARNALATSLSYSTDITGTESFFAESVNETTGCKSSRVEVSATAYTIPAVPVLTAQSHCGPQSFSLTAPTTGYYRWYDSASSSEVLPISDNTTPVLNASRSYFISQAADYTGITCESNRSEWALTIYPVYEAQDIYDTICQHNTYTQHGLSETFDVAGDFDRILSSQSIHGCDSSVTLHLNVKEVRNYEWNHTACDSYTWNAENYTANGNYIQHFTSSLGCDSTVTLHLTVNKSKATEFSTSSCDSYTWNTTTYTESGDYAQSFQTTAGCDSTVTLHLTINPSKANNIYETACNSYTWNAQTYTASGNYNQSFQTTAGCDSTVTLHLTINYSDTAYYQGAICLGESYTEHGFNITPSEAGTATYSKEGACVGTGCDSTTILTLLVHPTYNLTETRTICESALPYTWNDITYPVGTPSGEYTHTYSTSSIFGCDSIITLNLTISNKYVTHLTENICRGESYLFGSRTLTETGLYYDSLRAANNCDSIVYLTLTVHELDTTYINDAICLGGTYTLYGFNITPSETGVSEHQRTVQTVFGCDSTVILTLTTNPVQETHFNDEICLGESYTQHGFNLTPTQAGIVNDTQHLFCAGTGCDSTVYLTLTVHPSYNNTFDTTVCDQFVWNGNTYTESGLLSHTYELSTGCDSTVNINLTVNHSYTTPVDTTVCDVFFAPWAPSTPVTESTVLSHHYSSVNGCDSLVTISLTVNHSVTDPQTLVICQNELPYTWRDTTFEARTPAHATFSFHRQTSTGCDSLVTLDLTVNPSYDDELSLTICDNELPYTWRDTTFEAGTPAVSTHSFYRTTLSGCDSLVTLHLIINETNHTDIYASICNGERYQYNGVNYSVTGDYPVHFTNVNQCDSVVTLHLTVHPVFERDTTVTICEGALPYHFADTVFTAAGSKTVNLTSAFGCDSIYNVTLRVNSFITHTQNTTICANELPYHLGDSIFYAAGNYTVITTHEDGCNEYIYLTLNVNPTYESTDIQVACGSYVWNRGIYSSTLTESGLYTDTLSTINGCDSILHLNLTINPVKETPINDIICQGERYNAYGFDITPATAGIHRDTLHLQCAGTGCDSTVSLTLLVNPSYNNSTDTTVCDQFVWNGITYTESGLLSHTYELATGCDSTVNINLTVNYSVTTLIDTTVCDLFFAPWAPSTPVTESTVLNHYYTSASGCDSLVSINLTVNHSVTDNQSLAICENELPYTWRDTTFEVGTPAFATYTFHRQTSTGCDSTVVLALTIHPSYDESAAVTICENALPYIWRDTTFNTGSVTGTYVFHRVSAFGCDSTVTLDLTVNPTDSTHLIADICNGESYYFDGRNRYSSGDYVAHYNNQYSCDSTVILHLTVNPTFHKDTSITVCEGALPYVFADTVFTAAGTKNILLHSIHGCDSSFTLTLFVTPFTQINKTVTLCDNELPYQEGDSIFYAAGQYTVIETHEDGCNIYTHLNLIVNPTYEENLTAVACDAYTWTRGNHSSTLYESGIYSDTLQTLAGCDSILHLHLTINHSKETRLTPQICLGESYTENGFNIVPESAGTYLDTLYHFCAGTQCDSTVYLNLTVNPSYLTLIDTSVCDVFVWENQSYTESGILNFTHTLATGCDSIITIDLTVNHSVQTSIDTTVCDVFFAPWATTTAITSDTVISHHYMTAAGCDSLVTIDVTVNNSVMQLETLTLCDNELPYTWRDTVFEAGSQSGTYIFHRQTSEGCDSTVTLQLTVNPTYHVTESADNCSNETPYIWHNMILTASGIYRDTVASIQGCDSICEMHFTMLEPSYLTLYDTTCENHPYSYAGFSWDTPAAGDSTFQRIIENVAGCDSTITLHLHVSPTLTNSFDTIACQFFTWNSQTYFESGSYQQTFAALTGCDSIVTMNLTIDVEHRDTVYASNCDSYEWDGTTYFQSGVYSKVYPRSIGCDSVATLMLTIFNSTETDLSDTICFGDHYNSFGFDTIPTNMGICRMEQLLQTSHGCDSLVKMELLVKTTYLETTVATTCDNEPYQWRGHSCDTTGLYIDQYTAVNHCDSIFALYLTVYPTYSTDVTDTALVGVHYNRYGMDFTPTQTGTFEFNIPEVTVNNCDSIVNLTLIVVENVGIGQAYFNKSVSLYPNPTEDHFTISSTMGDIKDVMIYDNSGKLVLQRTVNDRQVTLDAESLAAGMYIVRIRTNEGIANKKLIVK